MKRKKLCSIGFAGQTAILVVLVGTVVATMGLATVARTVTNVQISTQIENAHVALQAAEAGVAVGLSSATGVGSCNVTTSPEFINVIINPCDVTGIGANLGVDVSMGTVKKGESRTIWLIPHDQNEELNFTQPAFSGNLNVGWTYGELELIWIYQEGADFKLVKRYYDSPREINLSFPPTPKVLAIRLKPTTQNTEIVFKPIGGSFPLQGKIVDSTGRTRNGNITRRIVVTRWYPGLPGIFDYTLFGYGSLGKD